MAADIGTGPGGKIYTSTDSGLTWTPQGTNNYWTGIASSADGTKLVATSTGAGQIYVSTDSGITWFPKDSLRAWSAVASSTDGSKLAATVAYGFIYTSGPSSTQGTNGYLTGGQNTAVELQYVGNGTWMPLNHEGNITAF